MSPSSQSIRNSQFLDTGTPSSTPPVKRKFERLEKDNTMSFLRSDRGKENLSASLSGSKKCVKELGFSELRSNGEPKKKKEHSIQEMMESENGEVRQEYVGTKKKRITGSGRLFKSLYKKQHNEETVPDVEGKLEGLDKPSHTCSNGTTSSEKAGKLDVGSYSTNIPMVGEAKASPQSRKRVQNLDGSPGKSDTENDDVEKKRRTVNENVDPASVLVGFQEQQATQVAGSEGGPSRVLASKLSQSAKRDSKSSQSAQRGSVTSISSPNDMSGQSSFGPEANASGAEERNAPSDEQKSLHSSLQGEIGKLCQILKLSKDVTYTMRRFMEFAILNYNVTTDSPALIQAFQISLYWIAVSISKQEVDKKESLVQAKQILNYQCTEEQCYSVYSKMQNLQSMYLQRSLNTIDSGGDYLLARENINKETFNVNEGSSLFPSVKTNTKENSIHTEHSEGQILLQQNQAAKGKISGSGIDSIINDIQEKCDKRMKRLIKKQQGKIQEFHRIWQEKKSKLEKEHTLEAAFIRTIYGEGSARIGKLKLLDDKFAKTMEENNLLKEKLFKDLEMKQLASRNEEEQKAARWLAEAKACCSSELRAADGPQFEEDARCSQSSTHILGTGGVDPLTRQPVEDKNISRSVCVQGNDVAPSDTSVSSSAEEVGYNAPIGTPINLVSTNLQTSDRSVLDVVEKLNQPEHAATGEIICAKLPASGESVHDEMRLVELNKEVPPEVPETVSREIVDYVNRVESSNASNRGGDEGDTIGSPEDLLNQRDGTGVLCSTRKILEPSELIENIPHVQNDVGLASSDRSILAVVEQLNEPEHVATGESGNLPAYGESVPDEMRLAEMNKEVPPQVPETVSFEIGNHVNTDELSNASDRGCHKGDTIGLPDCLVNQRDGTDETPDGVLCLARQILEPSEQMENSPHPQNEVGLASSDRSLLDVVEQLHQPKHFDTKEISSANLPASGERIPDEMRSVQLNKEVPSELPEIVDHVNPVESSNASNRECDKGDTIGLPDGFLNQRDGTDETPTGVLPLARQTLEPSEQTEDSPHHCDLLPLQVPEDQFHQSMSAELQEQGAKEIEQQNTLQIEVGSQIHDLGRSSSQDAAVAETEVLSHESASQLEENLEVQTNQLQEQGAQELGQQNTLRIEVAASECVDTSTILQLQDRDVPVTESTSDIETATLDLTDTIAPEQSRMELPDRDAPRVEDQGTSQIEFTNSTLVGDVAHVQSNVDAQEIENCEQLHRDCNQSTAVEVESQIHDLGRSSSQAAAVAEAEVRSHESASLGENLEVQTNLLDMGSLNRASQDTSVELTPSLQNNVAMLQAVVGTVELSNQDFLPLGIPHLNHQVTYWNSPPLIVEPLQIELDKMCKETEQLEKSHKDMISRLRSDCEKEIKEIIAQIHNKYEVKLQDAEAKFRLKNNELDKNQKKVLMNKLLAEAFGSKCVDFLPLALLGMQQGTPSSSIQHSNQLPLQHSVRQIPPPTTQAMQQLMLPRPIRHFSLPHQNILSPPLQHGMPLSSATTSRPPIISAVSPTSNNLHFGREAWAPPPHLQPFRPPPLTSQYQPEQSQRGPPPQRYPSLSALDLLMDVDHRNIMPGNRFSSCPPEMSSSFGSLGASFVERVGSVQGNQTTSSAAVAIDAICLSDDD